MHAEDKKILKENSLVHQVSLAYAGLKHGPSRSTYFLIGFAVIIVVSVVLFRYLYRSSEAAASHRWVQIDDILYPEQLTSLADNAEFKGTPQGRFIRFKEARLTLARGLRDLAADPSGAKENLEKGTQIYEDLARVAGNVPLLHQEALWGSAKGLETLGDVDKARSYYDRLVREHPTSAMGKDAARQVERLDSDQGKKEARELAKILTP